MCDHQSMDRGAPDPVLCCSFVRKRFCWSTLRVVLLSAVMPALVPNLPEHFIQEALDPLLHLIRAENQLWTPVCFPLWNVRTWNCDGLKLNVLVIHEHEGLPSESHAGSRDALSASWEGGLWRSLIGALATCVKSVRITWPDWAKLTSKRRWKQWCQEVPLATQCPPKRSPCTHRLQVAL